MDVVRVKILTKKAKGNCYSGGFAIDETLTYILICRWASGRYTIIGKNKKIVEENGSMIWFGCVVLYPLLAALQANTKQNKPNTIAITIFDWRVDILYKIEKQTAQEVSAIFLNRNQI